MKRLGAKDCAAVTDGQLQTISSLTLHESGLASLQAHDFHGLVQLKWLYLQDNDLTELPEGVFRGLAHLEELYLSYNFLTGLPVGVFGGLDTLKELHLQDNDLTELPEGVFRGLAHLEELYLSYNFLTGLPVGVFGGLDTLKELHLHRNLLRGLPKGIFDDLLDTLVTAVPDRDIYGLTVPRHLRAGLAFAAPASEGEPGSRVRVEVRLTQPLPVAVRVPFTLEGNVGEVRPDPRAGLMILAGETAGGIELRLPEGKGSVGKTIELQMGERDQIGVRRSDGTGPDAPHLHTGVLLYRVWNRAGHTVSTVKEIERGPPPGTGGICDRTPQVREKLMRWAESYGLEVEDCAAVTPEDLDRVRVLYLEDSGLNSLQAHDFQGLTKLRQLHLDNNDLRALPARVFDGMERLEDLFLNDNLLQALPEGIFRDLTKLKKMKLYRNHLRALPAGIFDGLSHLEELFLSENLLTGLPEGVFRDLTGLRELWLHSNHLRALPAGVFDGLTRTEELLLGHNALESLPEGVFEGMAKLQRLWLFDNRLKTLSPEVFKGLVSMRALRLYTNRLRALPAGVFDDLLPTLGGDFRSAFLNLRGGLWVDSHLRARLHLTSEGQRAEPGTEVRVGVRLSRALPVAVRVPFELGVGGAVGGLSGLDPDPEAGLLFLTGEREHAITFRVEAGGAGEGSVAVTLAPPERIGLRRSDGSGPDAPYLATDSLVRRHEDRLVHTVRVSGAPPAEAGPYCLSLWEGEPCATVATVPSLRLGRWGEGEARGEVVLTHTDPGTEGCEAAVLFHRGAEPAPGVAFDGGYPEGNLLGVLVPRGGARILRLAAPGREAVEGAAAVFTRWPCIPDSLQVEGRSLLHDGEGEIEEMVRLEGQRPEAGLGDGECRRLTGVFGPGRGLAVAVVSTEPGQEAPPGTRLRFGVFDREGNYRGPLPDAAVSGSHQWLPAWDLEGLATVEACLEVPGESGFRLAVSPVEVREGGSGSQQAPGAFSQGR